MNRERFEAAVAAMQCLLSTKEGQRQLFEEVSNAYQNGDDRRNVINEIIAKRSVRLADALLAELAKPVAIPEDLRGEVVAVLRDAIHWINRSCGIHVEAEIPSAHNICVAADALLAKLEATDG
jgi:hypothetical protein